MAIVSVSLDTVTRQAVLTVGGVIVPTVDFMVEKYTFDGEETVRFSYTIESLNVNGMKERHQFFLPSLEEIAVDSHSKLNESGLASKLVYDDEKAKVDVVNYLAERKAR